MKLFKCQCGGRLYFENTQCLRCGARVGFAWGSVAGMLASKSTEFIDNGATLLPCKNAELGLCNWLVPAGENPYCKSCALSRTIPDLSLGDNANRLSEIEGAKRRVLYALGRVGLPIVSKQEDPSLGLCFDVLASLPGQEVQIGHYDGVITIALDEADPVHRERQRCTLGESYRTVLGHLRHEIGHYYFARLIEGSSRLDAFRNLFGDERADYQNSLQQYYAQPPAAEWEDAFVTPYASAHPWEDWAESWAHYMHTTSTSETALCHGLSSDSDGLSDAAQQVIGGERVSRDTFEQYMQFWAETSVVMNELNRSMGVTEAYPFKVRDKITDKLYFVHQTVVQCGDS